MHKRPYTMEQVDPDEEKLREVQKHVFGLIVFYVQVFVGVTLAVGLLYFLIPSVFGDSNQVFLWTNVFVLFALLGAAVVVLITSFVYKQNRLIITDRNITQVLQYGLFNRKVSQLNITNIEDVTAVQHGFIPTFFNYGVLRIETAGEQANFHFAYCPDANLVAKVILDAREHMLGQTEGSTVASSGGRTKVAATRNNANRAASTTGAETQNEHILAIKGIGAEVVEQATKE